MSDPQSLPPSEHPRFYQHVPYAGAIPNPYPSERTGTLTFGIVAIILGAISGCFTLTIPLSLLLPQAGTGTRLQMAQAISASLVYAGAAVGLIWGGMGMVQRRRWTRPLVLSLGSIALVCGVLGIIAFAFMMPSILRIAQSAPNQPAAPPGALRIGLTIGFIFAFILLVAIPAAFVWYFQKPAVKAMLEFYDPLIRWTDRCPIPVLALSMILFLYGGSLLLAIPQQIAVGPGFFLIGPMAAVWNILLFAIALTLAYLAHHLRPAGWWGSLMMTILLAIFYGITLWHSDLAGIYKQAGYPPQTVDMMRQMQGGLFELVWIIPFAIVAIFIGALGKYFNGKPIS